MRTMNDAKTWQNTEINMVKSGLVLLFVYLVACTTVFSQTAKEVFSNSETQILYLGVDFTKAKIIGEHANEFDIRSKDYPGLNDLIVAEPKKYELKLSFHKSFIDHDLGEVAVRNSKINAEDIISSNTADFHRLQSSDIETLVSGFDFGDKKGVGLLLVVEAFSKMEKATAVWVTLVDMKYKKVLMTERMQGRASGVGLRNSMAGSIKNILDEIEKTKYQQWKEKFNALSQK
ncbi:MAG: hypothetical protein JST47_12190 [Bacteroidetes bacterium]|nr:hypothetical protein [Bacteroidota bacterium]MBS1973149.1 hypothetical protein [Bacteroidota bacterium]